MKCQKHLINLLISFLSIYLPLLIFSIFDYLRPNNLVKILNERELKEDIPKKISAIQNGFLPVFAPGNILELDKIPNIYPIGGLPYTNTFFCNEGIGLIKYYSDRFGLRNSDLSWDNVNKKNNIFFIGDSFIHGACVKDEDTITNHIIQNTNFNTLNLGIRGNTPYEYLALLKNVVNPILQNSGKKNKVFVVFYANDNIETNFKKESLLKSSESIIDNTNDKSIIAKKTYTNEFNKFIDQNYPLKKQNLIKEIKKNNNFKKSSFYAIFSLFGIRQRINSKLEFYKEFYKPINYPNPSEKTIIFLKEVCHDKCEPYILFIPNSEFWEPHLYDESYKLSLKNLSDKLRINFIDGEDILDPRDLTNYQIKGQHLSPLGYRKLSNQIIELIEDSS